MVNSQVVTMLQGFRGAQPIIILLFLANPVALALGDIMAACALSDKSAQAGIDALMAKDMLVAQTGEHGKRFYSPAAGSFFGVLGGGQKNLSVQIPQIGDSASTTTTTIGKGLIRDGFVVVEARQSPQIGESGKVDDYDAQKEREKLRAKKDRERADYYESHGVPYSKNLEACKLYGIGEPSAARLAELKHVTPKLIIDHVRSLKDGETLGLAIVRIRSDEMPRLWLDELLKDAGPSPTLNQFIQKKRGMMAEFTEDGADDGESEDGESEEECEKHLF